MADERSPTRRTSSGLRAAPRALVDDLRSEEGPKTSTLVVVAAGGLLVGGATAVVDRIFGWPPAARDFGRTPQFLTWLILVCLEVSSWAVGAVYVVRALRKVGRYGSGQWREIAIRVSVLVALMITFAVVSRKVAVHYETVTLPGLTIKTAVLTVLGAIVALGAAVAMWLMHAAVQADVVGDDVPDRAQLEQFVARRRLMQTLLTIQGAILGGAILGAGALRKAILAYDPGATSSFPQEYILMYGAFLSGLVALCYAPTQAAILALGRKLRDRCLTNAPSPHSDAWSGWYARRKALDEMLGLDVGPSASLRAGAAILTPLAAGVVGLLLPTSH
ncbi:MAG: hypothetical protein QOD24_4508 [Solirubrobacteraceae bacterium]|nr:hypothetical protein [Solirubrobacteraceae bacterium]